MSYDPDVRPSIDECIESLLEISSEKPKKIIQPEVETPKVAYEKSTARTQVLTRKIVYASQMCLILEDTHTTFKKLVEIRTITEFYAQALWDGQIDHIFFTGSPFKSNFSVLQLIESFDQKKILLKFSFDRYANLIK